MSSYLDKYKDKVKTCPNCKFPIHYRKCRGVTVVVAYDDLLTVRAIIGRLNAHLSERSGFDFDLGEATGREMALAYKMIPWAERFMGRSEMDLGLTINEFLLGLMDFVLADEWWGDHITSLLQIQNAKQRLAWNFYESEARKRGVETPKSAKTRNKLKKLASSFLNGGSNAGHAAPDPF